MPEHLESEYRSFISERWEKRLDECHGECVLRCTELAKIVGDSLLHFDGDRYTMGDFVVMPNHVHLLVSFPGEDQLKSQCRSWKKYSATEINKRLNRRGEFWQVESFDHLIRSPEAFDGYRRYIARNPLWANLSQGEYLYYRAPHCGPVTP
ncbi:MAG TPA: transposase [Gemmataceae bacterium]|nr:transposase [Gemmataceae bacterium]